MPKKSLNGNINSLISINVSLFVSNSLNNSIENNFCSVLNNWDIMYVKTIAWILLKNYI